MSSLTHRSSRYQQSLGTYLPFHPRSILFTYFCPNFTVLTNLSSHNAGVSLDDNTSLDVFRDAIAPPRGTKTRPICSGMRITNCDHVYLWFLPRFCDIGL